LCDSHFNSRSASYGKVDLLTGLAIVDFQLKMNHWHASMEGNLLPVGSVLEYRTEANGCVAGRLGGHGQKTDGNAEYTIMDWQVQI
jgi:hypothetical protein